MVLFRKHYDEIVDTCEQALSSYFIQDFIDDVLKEYSDKNSDIISTLQEIILVRHPFIQGNNDKEWEELDNFYKKEFSWFPDDAKDYKVPEIRFTFSYLQYLAEAGIENITDDKNVFNDNVSFFTLKPGIKNLKAIYDLYLQEKYIDSTYEKFSTVFSGKKIQTDDRVKWIAKVHESKFTYYVPLFELITKLVDKLPSGKNNIESSMFYHTIMSSFSFEDNSTTTNTLRKRYHSYNKLPTKNKRYTSLREKLNALLN